MPGSGSGGGAVIPLAGATSAQGGGGGAVTCGAQSYQAMNKPLAMFLMVDQSGSMTDQGGPGGAGEDVDRWTPVSTALQAFVQDPMSSGIKVAVNYFPLESTDQMVKCDPTQYAAPAVPMGMLPEVTPAVLQSLQSKVFELGTAPQERSSTPTRPAFEGMVSYLSTWLQANPDHVGVMVLATDGEPTQCTQNAAGDVERAIRAAAMATPPIRTFVIGIGSFNNLNRFAVAGGTGRMTAFQVDATGTNTQAEFLAAMQEIRGAALPCQFSIPPSTTGTQDLNKVNVDLELGDGASKDPLVKVADPTACAANAWHYDNAANPTAIVLCPDACNRLTGDKSAKVSLALGCETRVF